MMPPELHEAWLRGLARISKQEMLYTDLELQDSLRWILGELNRLRRYKSVGDAMVEVLKACARGSPPSPRYCKILLRTWREIEPTEEQERGPY